MIIDRQPNTRLLRVEETKPGLVYTSPAYPNAYLLRVEDPSPPSMGAAAGHHARIRARAEHRKYCGRFVDLVTGKMHRPVMRSHSTQFTLVENCKVTITE